jgi:hypothetical protein
VPKKPLQVRELLKKLKVYGIECLSKRGKGSEIVLVKPIEPGSRKGPQYPIKNHGKSTEISIPVINKILERFEIKDNDFWD